MKIGGGVNSAFGGVDNAGVNPASKDKLNSSQNNSATAGNLGSVLSFGTSLAGNGQGVQFGSKESTSLAQTGNGQTNSEEGINSSLTQLLNAIMELLKNSGAGNDKTGTGSGNGSGASGTQDATGSGDIMTQLMEMIKKMLGQSTEGANASGQNGSSSASPQNGSGTQDQTQDGSGLAGKLGNALQMLGLGAILSALSGSGTQGSGDAK